MMQASNLKTVLMFMAVMMATLPRSEAADAPTVLVTGSNRGIGLEFVRQYASKGWTVIATCRTLSEADELNTIAEQFASVMVEPLDVSDHAAIDALAEHYSGTAIDVLLNNAGMLGAPAGQNEFGEIDYEVMEQVYRTNTLGPIKMAEAFLEHVAASEQKKIVAITSGTASISRVKMQENMRFFTSLYAYRLSKVALNMAMRVLAVDVNERGILVGIMAPGVVETRLLQQAGYAGRGMTPAASVSGVIKNIDNLTPETAAQYTLNTGESVPW
jgi:NAD(P)-dependent dehydrogenase (short-subunit alcohol dehydrogenase family)